MIAIAILVIGLFVVGLFTSLAPVIITSLVISSVFFVLCFSVPIVANIDKEGFGGKFDKQAKKKVLFWEIIYVILTLGNILLLAL